MNIPRLALVILAAFPHLVVSRPAQNSSVVGNAAIEGLIEDRHVLALSYWFEQGEVVAVMADGRRIVATGIQPPLCINGSTVDNCTIYAVNPGQYTDEQVVSGEQPIGGVKRPYRQQ